jgi:ribosomal protein S18 acetylase RimI-like enzyme
MRSPAGKPQGRSHTHHPPCHHSSVIIPALSQAEISDARAVVRLRDAAAEWQQSLGIDQWAPGEVTEALLADRALVGELFVARRRQDIIAAVVLQWDDGMVWGVSAAEAGYIHSLMIDRRHSGTGLGRGVLAWAETEIAARGRKVARLDCVESNAALRAYYRRAGYAEVSRKAFPPESGLKPVTLFEKHL